MQAETGELAISSHGPNSANLGVTAIHMPSGIVAEEYVLPIAGKDEIESTCYNGPWNLYSEEKEKLKQDIDQSPTLKNFSSFGFGSMGKGRFVVGEPSMLKKGKGVHWDPQQVETAGSGRDTCNFSYTKQLQTSKEHC